MFKLDRLVEVTEFLTLSFLFFIVGYGASGLG